jgi:hypothetical protein
MGIRAIRIIITKNISLLNLLLIRLTTAAIATPNIIEVLTIKKENANPSINEQNMVSIELIIVIRNGIRKRINRFFVSSVGANPDFLIKLKVCNPANTIRIKPLIAANSYPNVLVSGN